MYLDGKNTKLRTPATIENVPPGEHELKLVRNKFGSSTSSVSKVVVEGGMTIHMVMN